jgi:hypothetical protein
VCKSVDAFKKMYVKTASLLILIVTKAPALEQTFQGKKINCGYVTNIRHRQHHNHHHHHQS